MLEQYPLMLLFYNAWWYYLMLLFKNCLVKGVIFTNCIPEVILKMYIITSNHRQIGVNIIALMNRF